MKWVIRFVIAIAVSTTVTATGAVVSYIWVMFTGGSAPGIRYAFFNSLFFEVRETPSGTTELGVGLHDPLSLVLFFVAVIFVMLASWAVYDRLVVHRAQLIEERPEE